MIIAMDTAEMLAEMGADDVVTAATVADALAAIEQDLPSVAVLDVNLGDETSAQVARVLADRGVPFVLTTGYGSGGDVVSSYPACPVVQKPVSNETLAAAVAEAMGVS